MPDDTSQLTAADVTRMYSERRYREIDDARAQGRLNSLLGGEPPVDVSANTRLTAEDLTRLYSERRYDEISSLAREGRFIHLVTGASAPVQSTETLPQPARRIPFLTPADLDTKD